MGPRLIPFFKDIVTQSSVLLRDADDGMGPVHSSVVIHTDSLEQRYLRRPLPSCMVYLCLSQLFGAQMLSGK